MLCSLFPLLPIFILSLFAFFSKTPDQKDLSDKQIRRSEARQKRRTTRYSATRLGIRGCCVGQIRHIASIEEKPGKAARLVLQNCATEHREHLLLFAICSKPNHLLNDVDAERPARRGVCGQCLYPILWLSRWLLRARSQSRVSNGTCSIKRRRI